MYTYNLYFLRLYFCSKLFFTYLALIDNVIFISLTRMLTQYIQHYSHCQVQYTFVMIF